MNIFWNLHKPREYNYDEFICQDNCDHRCVKLLKAYSVDPQGLHVLAVGVALARAEVGEDLCRKFLSVGVEPGHVVCIVEDEQAFGVVQVHPHFLQLALYVEAGPRLGAGAILVPVMHNNAVEAAAGLDLDAALAADCFVGHADHPLGLLRHHHLPVMNAWHEALCTQNRNLHIKAARGVLQGLWMEIPIGYYGAVVWEDQSLVGCDGVEGQRCWHWGGKEKGDEGGDSFRTWDQHLFHY